MPDVMTKLAKPVVSGTAQQLADWLKRMIRDPFDISVKCQYSYFGALLVALWTKTSKNYVIHVFFFPSSPFHSLRV